MDKLESFLKEHASEKPLIINEGTLNNYEVLKEFEDLESRLEELENQGKIKVEHETFPPESTNKQIVIRWVG